MSYKLKQDSIRGFSSKVSEAICDRFYESKNRMEGASLMKLTDSKQVNAFLIKTLFEKWQEETQSLQSPYFDFGHDKVKEALATFMNVLSGYISVARTDLEPLLEQAVSETVLITFDPVAYVQSVVSRSGDVSRKYIKTRKSSFKQLESLTYVTQDDFDAEFPIAPADFVKSLGASIEDLFEEEITSFFDSIEDDADDEEELAVVEVAPEQSSEPTQSEPVPAVVPEPLKMVGEETEEEGDTVNTRFNGKGKVQTLADKLKQNTQKSLEASLNLNEKIMFTNALFGGDKEKMSEALVDMEEAGDLDGAKMKAYKYSESWDMESEEVAAFFEVIERRFD